jgi:L-lysine exporter family protein LysE/ArgO
MTLSPDALLRGFGLGAGLIIAIGAQNAFVLRQGLKRRRPFLTALVSTLGDMTLIALGVAGLGSIIAGSDLLTTVARWGGALFLLAFGLRSFRSALKPAALELDKADLPLPDEATPSVRATILTALGFSLLNPHVYLDTVVILGSLGAGYPPGERASFALGAMTASTLWFFGLAYGAAQLTPLFRRPSTWRALDVIIGVIMWTIAFSLVAEAL